MIRPVDAEISQRFGDNPTKNLPANDPLIVQFGNYQPDGHSGEDYSCPVGTPVRAVTDGTVLHIGWMGGTYSDNPWWVMPSFAGYCAVIDHGSFIGIYGHGSDGSARVSNGDRVTEGQVFFLSGNTGGSTGPHLHFEILPDGYILQSSFYGRIDPEPLFSGITAQSTTITPLKEGYLMALTDQDQQNIYEAQGRIDAGVAKLLAAVAKIDAIQAATSNIPLAVLTAQFRTRAGATANVAGALSEILSQPAPVTNVTNAPAAVDIDALVARLKAELPAAVLAELTAKLTK